MNISDAYRDEFLRSRFPLPTEEMVQDLENRLGVTLPDSYRTFILDFNGSFFDRLAVKDNDNNGIDGLDVLYGINSTHPSGELGRNVDIFDNNAPVIILPIGFGACGVVFCMYVAFEEERGEIVGKWPSKDEYIFFFYYVYAFFEKNVFPVVE